MWFKLGDVVMEHAVMYVNAVARNVTLHFTYDMIFVT
jgi:hypothetical protein